jgi:hypothetical protein
MKTFIIFLFVLGLFLIINSIYKQKYDALKKNIHIQYRFIPRTYLEEQIENTNVSGIFKNDFNNADPWFERNVSVSKKIKDN